MRRSPSLRFVVVVLLALGLIPGIPPARADHGTFAAGDVFVGIGSSQVQWRHPDGTLNQVMGTAASSPQTTGMALGPNGTSCGGKLHVTGFTSNAISRFNTDGTPDGVFASDFNSHPESIVFDAAGNAYVGQESGSRDILKLNCNGGLLGSFDAAPDGKKGTDRIDLAGNQCTMYYTSQAKRIKRFDVCSSTQLSDLTTALPGKAARELRILLDGTVLVADTEAIHRVSTSGAIVETYDATGVNCWTALALADAHSFWAGCGSSIHRFELGTFQPVQSLSTGTKTNVQGLSVFRGPTAATSADLSVAQVDTPDPVSSSTVTSTSFVNNGITVTNNGPAPTAGVTLSIASQGGGTIQSASGAGWVCTVATTTSATCTLGPAPGSTFLAVNATASVDVLIQVPTAPEGTQLITTASVAGFGPDPDATDDSSTETTTVGAAVRDHRITYCSGCTTDTDITGDGPDSDDNTTTRIVVPPGHTGVLTIDEATGGIACGRAGNSSQESLFVLPEGYDDPNDPIVLILSLHSSSGVGGNDTILCALKEGETEVIVVPACLVPGVADPSPCFDDVTKQGSRTDVRSLWLSVDPFIKGG
jgi:hypothetical protein